MSNPLRGETPLKLGDGREFTLVLDMDGLIEAESAYGKPLPRLVADSAAGFMGALRALLYGAMKTKHPEASLRDASAMLQANGAAVEEALASAVEAAFPAPEKSEGGDGKNPPGKRSGRSGAKRV